MTDIAKLLGAIARQEAEKEAPKARPMHEAQIHELRECAKDYGNQHRFKKGDLVTPRSNGFYKHAGEPHLVVEVLDNPKRNWVMAGNVGDPNFGARLDMRILSITDGDNAALAFWVESWMFTNYQEAAAS